MAANRKAQTLRLLAIEAEYYGREVSETAVRVYWDGLRKHEPEDIAEAMAFHRSDFPAGRFFPTLADLVSLLESDHRRFQRPAEAAWSTVMAALHDSASAKGIECEVTRHALSDLGGMHTLGATPHAGLPSMRRTFIDLFIAAARGRRKQSRRIERDSERSEQPESMTALLRRLKDVTD